MTKTFTIDNGQKPTEESPAMQKAFGSAVVQRNRRKDA